MLPSLALITLAATVRGQAPSPPGGPPNSILDEPAVECKPHEVAMRFKTARPFNGHVFVRGHYYEDTCHQDFVLNGDTGAAFNIDFDKCGMRRKRSANPPGMGMSTTVVVSFHRHFITGMDRAFQIQCFYMETDKILTQSLHVSMMPTTMLAQDPLPMPECQYRVLSGGPLGPIVTFTKVGDRVYHDWHCVYPLPDFYCMFLHSCTVDDGEASVFEVIDKDGCPRDTTVLGELAYADDLRAGAQSSVFKFADKPRVYFSCQVRLSLKQDDNGGVCPRPSCGFAGRRRRRAAEGPMVMEVDVIAPPILIADVDDAPPPEEWVSGGSVRGEEGVGGLCVSAGSVGLAAVAVSAVGVFALISAAAFCLKSRQGKY